MASISDLNTKILLFCRNHLQTSNDHSEISLGVVPVICYLRRSIGGTFLPFENFSVCEGVRSSSEPDRDLDSTILLSMPKG